MGVENDLAKLAGMQKISTVQALMGIVINRAMEKQAQAGMRAYSNMLLKNPELYRQMMYRANPAVAPAVGAAAWSRIKELEKAVKASRAQQKALALKPNPPSSPAPFSRFKLRKDLQDFDLQAKSDYSTDVNVANVGVTPLGQKHKMTNPFFEQLSDELRYRQWLVNRTAY